MTKFLLDVFKALCLLKNNGWVHGCLRPEAFYYDSKNVNYVLIDRVFNIEKSHYQIILDYLIEGENIYLAPEIFEAIMN